MGTVIQSYADCSFHREIGALIEQYSENKQDVGILAASLLEAKGDIGTIVDLGCGYGWFEERLKGPYDYILGVDCHSKNEEQFLGAARRIAAKAAFLNILLPAPVPAADESFDVAVAAYSLYFFPQALAETYRLLRRGGSLLVITHSESMMEEGERHFDFRNLRRLIRSFSAENGEAQLRRHFADVQVMDYPNALLFPRGSLVDLEKYIEFKKEFIVRDVEPEKVKEAMAGELATKGEVRLNKNDRIFLATK